MIEDRRGRPYTTALGIRQLVSCITNLCKAVNFYPHFHRSFVLKCMFYVVVKTSSAEDIRGATPSVWLQLIAKR